MTLRPFLKVGKYVVNPDAIAYTESVRNYIDVYFQVSTGGEGNLRPKKLHLTGDNAKEMEKHLDSMVMESG